MHAEAPDVAEIRQVIKHIVAETVRLPADSLDEDASIEALGLSSLMLVQVITSAEDHYATTLNLPELTRNLTPTLRFTDLLDDLARHIHAHN